MPIVRHTLLDDKDPNRAWRAFFTDPRDARHWLNRGRHADRAGHHGGGQI